MALIKDGYWPDTYWASRYWQEDYWPEYGLVTTAEGGVVPRGPPATLRRRRWLLLYKLRKFLEAELSE